MNAKSSENFEAVQRWLVDSLQQWLLDVQGQVDGGAEYSLLDDGVHRAQNVRKGKTKDIDLDEVDVRSRIIYNSSRKSSFKELLIKIGTEHTREVEELRSENESLRTQVCDFTDSMDKEQRDDVRKDWQTRTAPKGKSVGYQKLRDPPAFDSALQQACEIYFNEECNSEDHDDDVNQEKLPLQRPSTAKASSAKVSASGTEARTKNVTLRQFTQDDDSSNDDCDQETSASAAYRDGSMRLDAQMEVEQDLKKKAATICTLFTSDADSTLLLPMVFLNWANMAKQNRRSVHFPMRQTWTQAALASLNQNPSSVALAHRSSARGGGDNQNCEWLEACELPPKDSRCGFLILHPGNSKRLAWDLIGAALLFVDMVLIPLQAFQPEWGLFTLMVDWVTLIFWTLDTVASCITGYVDKGVTVMDPVKIWMNYFKTWFILDLIVVVPDWVFTFMDLVEDSDSNDAGKSSNLLRALRIVRVARLLRLVKLKRIGAMIRDRIDSEMVFIVANIFKLIGMLLAVNHFLACCWYFIGFVGQEWNAANWIQSDQGFASKEMGYKYTTALHWSLTQFTPASMSVQPQNAAERTFAITVLVFGLVLFSSFISNITTSMTQLRSMQDDKTKQFWLLRRYLRQHGISTALSFRVLRYLEYACREQKDLVSEQRVQVLNLLSDQLKLELQYVVSFSCMMSHPLFERTSNVSSVTMHRLSNSGLSQQALAVSDVLFNAGSVATHMHIIVSGDIQYVKADDSHFTDLFDSLHKDDWLTEATLWTPGWVHLGVAKATTECKLVSIDSKEFGEVIQKDVQAWEMAAAYAKNFISSLNHTLRGILSDAAHCEAMRPICNSFLYGEDYVAGKRSSKFSVLSPTGSLQKSPVMSAVIAGLQGRSSRQSTVVPRTAQSTMVPRTATP